MISYSRPDIFRWRPSWRASIFRFFRRFCALLLLLLPFPATAWNAAGHRLVAAIAWDQLDADCRSEVSSILHAHPDHPRWLRNSARAGADESGRAAFVESSTWPDDIRKDQRFYDAGRENPTATVHGFPDMARHRDWHYINRPLDTTSSSPSPRDSDYGQLDRRLKTLVAELGSSSESRATKAYALSWLIHLVGDAHQPLHASAPVDAKGLPEGRRVIAPDFRSRPHETTLHAFWDDLPGPPWLRGARLDAAYTDLLAHHAHPAPSLADDWLAESWRLARDYGYPGQAGPKGELGQEFVDLSRQVAHRRIVDAGYRLADLLSERVCRQRSD